MSFPKYDEDVLVKLDFHNLFAIAEYYEGEWTPSQSTNPMDGEESYVLSGNVVNWYSIPKSIKKLLKKPQDKLNNYEEEVLVQLKSGRFAVAIRNKGMWAPGSGTHPSYLDIYPVLDSAVTGWINIEDFLEHVKNQKTL